MTVQPFLAAGVSAVVVVASRFVRALSPSGAVAAFVVGVVVYGLGGGVPGLALGAMFASASVLSRVGEKRWVQARSSERDWVQVAANGAAACACVIAWLAAGDVRFRIAAVGAMAAAASDTASTEVGRMFGRAPRLVTTWARVEPGTSGGMTMPGTLGGVVASALVGCAVLIRSHSAWWFLPVFAGGVAGTLFDSFLGAAVQARYRDRCGAMTEVPTDEFVGGVRWVNNDVVNVAATIVGGAATFLLA